jgi:hypothetical protein
LVHQFLAVLFLALVVGIEHEAHHTAGNKCCIGAEQKDMLALEHVDDPEQADNSAPNQDDASGDGGNNDVHAIYPLFVDVIFCDNCSKITR